MRFIINLAFTIEALYRSHQASFIDRRFVLELSVAKQRFFGRSVGRSVGRCVGWSVGRLVGWSVGRLVGWSVGRLVGWGLIV